MNDSTSDTIKVDTARLPLLLRELRLPTIAAMWQDFTERADREGWPAARLLATLTELELAERDQRRIQRHLLEARLPVRVSLARAKQRRNAVHPAKRSTVSILPPFRCSVARTLRHLPPSHSGTLACRPAHSTRMCCPNAGQAMDGSTEVARSCCLARAARENRISAPPSATLSSGTATGS